LSRTYFPVSNEIREFITPPLHSDKREIKIDYKEGTQSITELPARDPEIRVAWFNQG